MKATMLWTINDFPAYVVLLGYITKGNLTCPYYHSETPHCRLRNGSEISYMGHHCFLALDHKWCNQKSQFNCKKERKKAPKQLFGDDVLKQIFPLELIIFEKYGKK